MPINRQQRLSMADRFLQKYFPSLDNGIRKKISENIADQFQADYSPIKCEQDHRTAIGQGASFEEFTIAIGELMSDKEPNGVALERMNDIRKKVWTF